jgi:hypothetical protein
LGDFGKGEDILRDIFRLAWDRFGVITSVIADVQGRVIATGFYFTILVPFALISRFSGDPLRRDYTPGWLDHPSVPSDLESAKRQG